mgnify:CR=1 FL=1
MIAVWIVATAFTLVGLVYSLPKWVRLATCRGKACGTFVSAGSAFGVDVQPGRAAYEYEVDGVRYMGTTGWTNFLVVRVGAPCRVRYCIKKPARSYLVQAGTYINAVLGSVFFIAGLGIYAIGVLLMACGIA